MTTFKKPNQPQSNNATIALFRFAVGSFSALAMFYTGCAMCCGPYDYHYPNHGGSVQRADPTWGRVGSVFSDPGPFGGPNADYNLAPHGQNEPYNDDEIDSFEPISDDNNGFDPPNDLIDSSGLGTENGELPPPRSDQRPGPDDTTSIRRLRNQSKRGVSRWR